MMNTRIERTEDMIQVAEEELLQARREVAEIECVISYFRRKLANMQAALDMPEANVGESTEVVEPVFQHDAHATG